MTFLAATSAALVWNGALLGVYQSWLGHDGWTWAQWLGLLALMPFAAAGCALAGLAVYLGVPLRNPRVTFEAYPGQAEPGDTIEVAWRFRGALQHLRSVGIVLEGREEAWRTTRVGRLCRTAIFRRLTLLRTSETDRLKSGGAAIRLPPDLVPSFSGTSNRIAWYLCIQDGVGRWPHLRQCLPLMVRPPTRLRHGDGT